MGAKGNCAGVTALNLGLQAVETLKLGNGLEAAYIT